MRDAVGNKITEKSLLCWHLDAEQLKRGLIVYAVSVSDGGIALGDSRELSPATLLVQVPIMVSRERGQEEPTVQDILCIVNPAAEAALESLMGEVKGRTQ